ncbi:hypothetical protein J6590_049003 [Homalodisca vitripennis]|nr:hypothetical protein J6590_049003 [Homalodisca vitripennis]
MRPVMDTLKPNLLSYRPDPPLDCGVGVIALQLGRASSVNDCACESNKCWRGERGSYDPELRGTNIDPQPFTSQFSVLYTNRTPHYWPGVGPSSVTYFTIGGAKPESSTRYDTGRFVVKEFAIKEFVVKEFVLKEFVLKEFEVKEFVLKEFVVKHFVVTSLHDHQACNGVKKRGTSQRFVTDKYQFVISQSVTINPCQCLSISVHPILLRRIQTSRGLAIFGALITKLSPSTVTELTAVTGVRQISDRVCGHAKGLITYWGRFHQQQQQS